jgi:nitronate monooxygenase
MEQPLRQLTDKPFAVNLFSFQASDENTRIGEVQQELNGIRDMLGIPHAAEGPVITSDHLREQFAVLLEAKVPVISTAFGVLPIPFMQQAKAAGFAGCHDGDNSTRSTPG